MYNVYNDYYIYLGFTLLEVCNCGCDDEYYGGGLGISISISSSYTKPRQDCLQEQMAFDFA